MPEEQLKLHPWSNSKPNTRQSTLDPKNCECLLRRSKKLKTKLFYFTDPTKLSIPPAETFPKQIYLHWRIQISWRCWIWTGLWTTSWKSHKRNTANWSFYIYCWTPSNNKGFNGNRKPPTPEMDNLLGFSIVLTSSCPLKPQKPLSAKNPYSSYKTPRPT